MNLFGCSSHYIYLLGLAAIGIAMPTSAAPVFTDVTTAVGITHAQTTSYGRHVMTGGAAAGDFDGDGLVDLFFTRVDAPNVLYRNTGSGFEDVSAAAGFSTALPSAGAAAGDIDNDGDLDLYVTSSEYNRYFLYINDGASHFNEGAMFRGAAVVSEDSTNRRGQGVAFGDYDRDGYLDILTSDHSRPTATSGARLLRNLGAANPGHFEDVTHAAGLDVYRTPLAVPDTSYRFTPQFTDIDRDGHTDILFTSDSRTSQLFWNNGDGTFTDGTVAAGVGTDKSGMGSAVADYDRDGDLDWFITAIFDTPFLGAQPGNRLYRNNGNRTFTDVTTAAGVRNAGWGWGTSFLDYDNDADQDLIATNGFISGFGNDPTTLWRNNSNGTFSDVSVESGITDRGQGRGLLRVDYDDDGDLDVVVVNYAGAPILYRNDGGNDSNWLRVKPAGDISNRDGIGAFITVVPDSSQPDDFQIWEISSGSSYLSQEELTAHFGLGDLTASVDLVMVEWPSGIEQRFVDVPINSMLVANERLLGDFNADGRVDAGDFTIWRDAAGMIGEGLAADHAGPLGAPDGIVDDFDYRYWKANFGLEFNAGMATNAVLATVPEPGSLLFLTLYLMALSRPFARRISVICLMAVPLMTIRPASAVDIWITTGDKSQLLTQKSDVVFQAGAGSGGTEISVSSSTTFQTMAGFGAAMTDSSAWLIQNELSPAQRDKLMRQLFSPSSGIGINYLRVPIGASDFTASGFYTYNDNPPGGSDDLQQHFSIAHDESYIIPRLQQAVSLNPELKLMASPWSAPAWMKTNNSLLGGSLAPQWEASYARYLAKFIAAYDAKGLPMDAITLQNEPLHTSNYPTMSMSAAQQANLIKNHIGPHFAAEGIGTKIVVYDHNWDNPSYPIEVLSDPLARQYASGTAFHAYAGSAPAQTAVHNAHPDKDIYFTEITGGEWATNFGNNLVWNFQHIFIGATRNWAKTALLWNLALDQDHGPHRNGCSDCRGVVTIDTSTGGVVFNEEFYALGQMTKAVQPGAVRIHSTSTSSVNTVAFLNPDGSQALVALNPNASPTTVRVVCNGSAELAEVKRHFKYELPGKSATTFLWNGPGADFDNGGFDDGGFHQGGSSLDAWTVFGNGVGNVSAATEGVLAGDRSLKLSGQSNGAENASGVSQGMSASAGDFVEASASALVRSADTIAGTSNVAQMKIQFYREYGGAQESASLLGENEVKIADRNSSNNHWHAHRLTGSAPPGTAEARLVFQFYQPNGESGAVHIDSATFSVSDRVSLRRDYNRDGVVSQFDGRFRSD